nr:MAG TPA: hypothetical protein [Caudoviricetes sp.]
MSAGLLRVVHKYSQGAALPCWLFLFFIPYNNKSLRSYFTVNQIDYPPPLR